MLVGDPHLSVMISKDSGAKFPDAVNPESNQADSDNIKYYSEDAPNAIVRITDVTALSELLVRVLMPFAEGPGDNTGGDDCDVLPAGRQGGN